MQSSTNPVFYICCFEQLSKRKAILRITTTLSTMIADKDDVPICASFMWPFHTNLAKDLQKTAFLFVIEGLQN